MSERDYDLVLYGATGFTGALVAEYLLETYGTEGELRWAIAGRSIDKLREVRRQLLPSGELKSLPLVVADSADADSLAAMAASTRVVCSTVGPYALYGTPLVEACIAAGTDYCDLTGEVQWMSHLIPHLQSDARTSGARIVHCCGFDSIPSDMGVWYVQRAMQKQHGVSAPQVRGRVGRNRGSASGGTIASMMNMMEEAAVDRSILRTMANPYALYPAGAAAGKDKNDRRDAFYDEVFQQWTAPFVMAAINTRVVRRSNALLDFAYGEDFRYDEAALAGPGLAGRARAVRNAALGGAGMLAMAFAPGRKLASRVLPAPGEGPDKAAREAGYYELFFHASHPEDPTLDLRARVSAELDPGYGSTARMLGESAACLACDTLSVAGGFWTPASAMGEQLLPRLQQRAGVSFELLAPPF